jgi:hypothetical protein
MKKIVVILLCVFSNFAFGQFIENISFTQLPQDYQLFPRDANRNAIIPINGTVLNRWKTISVLVMREGKIHTYQKTKTTTNFALNPIIKAEKAEYSIKIYASDNDRDSTFIVEKKNIVAGDFYVIYGDSNGNTQNVVPVDYYSENKYIRAFGRYNHEVQKDGYLAKDTTWSQNENYSLPKVGIWGTYLQEIIANRYDIPVCIITGGGPGMHIDLLSDRTGNPYTTGGVYNSFGYRIKKSGLLDHIKGFFFWHGVYELFSKTDAVAYDKKLRKLMGFFQEDFPSTKQFYIFQSDMVKFSLTEAGADIRESQRNMASIFPKVTLYAAMGLKGSDGVHYSVEGYKKCAEEMLVMLEPQFYGKQPNLNVFSPNVQKVFYKDASHKSIKLVFQEGQNIVLGNDTTVVINGSNTKLSLKKYFYADKIFGQNIDIQSVINNENSILLQSNNLINAKTLSYLPPYHNLYASDFPVFVGPFIENSSGARSPSFAGIKIQEPLPILNNLAFQNTVSQIKLTWNRPNIPQNAQIILERKAEKEMDFKQLTILKSDIREYQDINLSSGTSFMYRFKILADSSESDYAQIVANTLQALGKPSLKTTILYNNKAQIDWLIPAGAEKFQVSWKSNTAKQFTVLNVSNSSSSSVFEGLLPSEKYTFRIEAFRGAEITADSVSVTMPSLLSKPELSSIILFYNSLKINWKAISGANSYSLEKKSGTEDFKKIATLDAKTTEWLEKDLKEKTTYSYRLKAFGDKTESIENSIEVTTPSIIATPEITADLITHESLRLQWKILPNATKYVLERQTVGDTTFTKILETDSLREYSDTKLKSNQDYVYRLKASSSVSESAYGKIEVKTLVILANQAEEEKVFSVFPNPTNDNITISFSEPKTVDVSVVDLLGKSLLASKIIRQKSITMNISSLPKGVYMVVIKGHNLEYYRKIVVE